MWARRWRRTSERSPSRRMHRIGTRRATAGALTEAQKDGLARTSRPAARTPLGPRLTDDAFHVLRPVGSRGLLADDGRFAGGPRYETAEFRADSRGGCSAAEADRHDRRRSAAPSRPQHLRGAVRTPPYGHGGGVSLPLEMAIELHRTRGMLSDAKLATGSRAMAHRVRPEAVCALLEL